MTTPTYLFIMWMCTLNHPHCPIWDSPKHVVVVQPTENRLACKALWAETEAVPDPDGLKAQYRCQPISEDL